MANAADRVRVALLEGAGAPGRRLVPALMTVNLPPAAIGGLYFALGRGRGPIWAWAIAFFLAVGVGAAALVVVMLRATGHEQRSDELADHLTVTQAQSERRRAVADLLVSLARRNQSLLERQLELIDDLESREQDPAALAGLFRIDHFATRMRRNAESLLVLSGSEPGRRWADPLNVSEVVRGAVAEVEDYTRVDIAVSEDPPIAGGAVSDVAHLLAELIENAAAFSPPEARVAVYGRSVGDGYEIRVEDHGVGMTAADLATRNLQLIAPTDFDVDVSRMLGLHVVSRLSARHGLSVVLEPNPSGGVTAIVALPATALHDARGLPELSADDVAGPVGLTPEVADVQAVSAGRSSTPNPPRHSPRREGGPVAEAERRFFGGDPRAPRPRFTIPAPPTPPPLNRPAAAASPTGSGMAPPATGRLVAPADGTASSSGPLTHSDGPVPFAGPLPPADRPRPSDGPLTYSDGPVPLAGPVPLSDGPAPFAGPVPLSDGPAPFAGSMQQAGEPQTSPNPVSDWPGSHAPEAVSTADDPVIGAAATTEPGIPLVRRVPQTHLAPAMLGQLAAPPPAAHGADPDLVRSRLSSYQHGLRSGRQTAAEQEQAEWADDRLAFGAAEEEW